MNLKCQINEGMNNAEINNEMCDVLQSGGNPRAPGGVAPSMRERSDLCLRREWCENDDGKKQYGVRNTLNELYDVNGATA